MCDECQVLRDKVKEMEVELAEKRLMLKYGYTAKTEQVSPINDPPKFVMVLFMGAT